MPTARFTIVGKNRESGDTLVHDAALPADVTPGDVIALAVTGAYAYAMSSNDNGLYRPGVVFVPDGQARSVVRRESIDDLLRTQLPLHAS